MEAEIMQRLAAQERLLHAILAALVPSETDGSGFDDLVEILSDLTMAVADVTEAVWGLRWRDCNPPPVPEAPGSDADWAGWTWRWVAIQRPSNGHAGRPSASTRWLRPSGSGPGRFGT